MDDRVDPVEEPHPLLVEIRQVGGQDLGVFRVGGDVDQYEVVDIFPRGPEFPADIARGPGDQDRSGLVADLVLTEVHLLVHILVLVEDRQGLRVSLVVFEGVVRHREILHRRKSRVRQRGIVRARAGSEVRRELTIQWMWKNSQTDRPTRATER